jgi:hypothetical protein
MREDADLRARLRRAAAVSVPAPALATVGRRARDIHLRRVASGVLVAAIVAAGIVIPLAGLGGIGGARRDVGSIGAQVRPIGFEPSDGWAMAVFDPTDAPGQQTVFVTDTTFAPADLEGSYRKDGLVVLPTGANHTQRALPDDGVLLAASVVYRSRNPLPPDADFPDRALPLRLPSGSPETAWEGHPKGLSRYTLGGAVNGRFIVVNVYFGSKAPSESIIDRAQDELDRLIVDPAPAPVDEIDEFGVAIDLPPRWEGRLYAWASAPPIVELSTVPIDRHTPGSPMMPNRGLLSSQEDASVLLAESDLQDPGYEPLSGPISVNEGDRCDGCEVLDDGSAPPSGHALFHRAFETGGRSFDLYVEFCFDPTPSDFARVNDLLSRLVVDPAPTALGEESAVLELPAGWFQERDPLPALVDPVIVVAAGSWRFPPSPLIACGKQPALEALPPDGAFLWILRYPIGPGEFLGAFRHADPWPEHFTLDLPSRPSDAECADGTDGSVRQYAFSGPEGLYYQVQVALGTEADAATRREAEQVLSSFRP